VSNPLFEPFDELVRPNKLLHQPDRREKENITTMEQAKWTEDLAFDESELDEPQQRPPHHRSEWRSSEEDEDPVRVQVIPKLINLSGNRATAYRITDVAPIQKKRLEEEDEIILAAPTWTEDIKFGDIDNDEVGLAALKVETPRNRVLLEDHPLDEDFWLNEDIGTRKRSQSLTNIGKYSSTTT
jgi:hypothetical protein